jgi:NADH-quinone oxidoreductase subunit N
MLALAGVPGTVGFVGKFQLIHALVDGGYTWLAIVLVVGAMISLGYYLRVVAAMWMSSGETATEPVHASGVRFSPVTAPPIAGGSPEADALGGGSPEADALPAGAGRRPDAERPNSELAFVAIVFAGACVVFGIIPSPMFHLASHAGAALTSIF